MAETLRNEDIHPCDGCNGPLGPIFYVIDVNMAGVDLNAVREFQGLTTMFGGREHIASVFCSHQSVVKLNDDPVLKYRLLACSSCYCSKSVAELAELQNQRKNAKEAMRG